MKHLRCVILYQLGVLVSANLAPELALADVKKFEPSSQSSVEPTGEIFTGGTLTGNTWITWGGVVKSLSGSLYDEGWRLRALAAYGQYEFTSGGLPNTANPALFEITAGYQFKTGPAISKLYLGLHGEQHKFARPAPGNRLARMDYGLKVISENWIDLPMRSFVSLDGSFSTLNTAYQGQLRVGTGHYVERLSMGPELQVVGNEEFYQLRFGGFARWKLETGQIEASAGYTRDYNEKGSPYFSASWLKRF